MREWSTLRKLMFLKGATGVPLHEYTATGNPVKFETNKAKPLTKLLCAWTPTQSGTGDPAPDNVRPITGMDGVTVWHCGKNLFDKNNATILNAYYFASDLTITASNSSKLIVFPCLPNTQYVISKIETSRFRVADCSIANPSIGDILSNYGYNGDNVTVLTHTTSSDAVCMVLWVYNSNSDTMPFSDVLDSFQIEFGSTATTYEPYTGTTYAVEFPALGNNLFGAEIEQGGIIGSSGVETTSNTRVRTKGFIPLTKGKYTVSAVGVGQVYYYSYAEDGTYISDESNGFKNLPFTIDVQGNRKFRFAFRVSSSSEDVSPSDVSNVMLNVGTSALPYEPYTNTVYGGTLDLTTGVLTAEWARVKISDLTGWTYQSNQWGGRFRATLKEKAGSTSVEANLLCPIYKASTYTSDDNIILGYGTGNSGLVYIKDGRYTDEEDFVEAVGDEYIYYPLATPITYQLTPTQVTALIGNNTIWSDANGDCEVKFLKKG